MMSHVMVIGHRGNSMFAPENTLSSMNQAYQRGADVVEVDVQLTANGDVVAMHDIAVDRTTNGSGMVANLTVPQLKTLDAGSWFSDTFIGEQVPTLSEFLANAAPQGPVYLDIKSSSMGLAIRQVMDDLGLTYDRIWASADREATVADIHEHLPGASILWYGIVPRRGSAGYFSQMRAMGVTGFDLKWSDVSRRFARDAQENGMFFSTYTLNSPQEWRAALRMGVDGIETDDPGGLVELLSEQRGQVTAQVNSDQLIIQGDKFHNAVRIERGSQTGSLRVRGIHGTLINGQAGPIEFANIRQLDVRLLSGDDYLEIVDLILEGDLFIDSGAGNDRVSIDNSRLAGVAEFVAWAGSDWFTAERSTFAQLQVTAGSGRDILDIGLASNPNSRGNDFASAPTYSKVERLAS